MSAAGLAFALATLTFFPFARDAFELPHLLALAIGAALTPAPRLSATARWALGLPLLAALATTATSTSPPLGVPGLVTLIGTLLFAACAARVTWAPVVGASMLVAAWAALQATGHDLFAWDDVARWCGGVRPFATLGHPSQLGVWMGGLTVLALDLARRRASPWWLLAALVTSGVCVATLSRAGWLALAVGVVGYGAVLGRRGALARRDLVRGVGVLAGAAIIGALVLGASAVLERLGNAHVAPTRLALWRAALAGFEAHPWLGWGFDTFVLVDQQLRQPEAWHYEWGTTAGHAHAFPAQVLATQGLFGAGLHLAALAVVARAWWRRRAVEQTPAEVCVVIALLAASLVSFHGVLTSALGLVALVRSLEEPTARPLPPWWPWLSAGVATAAAAMLAASTLAGRGDDVSLGRAAALEPWNPSWPALQGARLEAAGRLAEARAAYEASVRRVPTLAVSLANVGRVASKQGDTEASLAAFEAARRLAPLDAHVALEAALASLRLGELELAAGGLERLLLTYPSHGPAWFALGRVRALQGRRVEARAMLQTSLEADWRDWPEGLGEAKRLLVVVLEEAGQLHALGAAASGPDVAPLPREACGAPARMR